MAELPKSVVESPTITAIYDGYKQHYAERNKPRSYLGASAIGNQCSRAIWYSYRWCSDRDIEGRIARLFGTGHREEDRVIFDLRAAGVTVYDVDSSTKKQFEFVGCGGHFKAHLDGVVEGLKEAPKTAHLLEVKTHNEKSFRAVVKHGVRKQKPEHWEQMQVYMGMAELTRACYFCVNKNTDELWIERVEFDRKGYDAIVAKAKRIIASSEPLDRAGGDAEKYPCIFCDHKAVCFLDAVPPAHCRTCSFATPLIDGDGGKWGCEKHGKTISSKEQAVGCADHIFIPSLVPFAEPIESGDDWVCYQVKDNGPKFFNGTGDSFPGGDLPHYSSAELRIIDWRNIGDPALEAVREKFKGEVVG